MKNFKKRGVSPVIAAILLIAVTIIAGVAVVSTVLLVINAEDPISITISQPESFSSTENDRAFYDSLVDYFILPITNDMREPLVLDTTKVFLYNATDDTLLDRWSLTIDDKLVTFQGKESLFLDIKTEGKFDTQEFSPGDQFYVIAPVRKSEDTDFVTFTSQTFTVSGSDTSPLYALEPINNAYQQGTDIYFDANLDQQNESRLLTFGIFNYGNADKEKTFSTTIQLENETLFSSDESFLVLTVPSQGPTNNDTVCELGEACVVASFNITKWANNRTKSIYSAYVSIGIDAIKFNLNFVPNSTEYYLTMPNSRRRNTNQWGEILQFNSPQFWREQTLELSIVAWNNVSSSSPLSATLEILNLNTTAFRLDSSQSLTQTIPAGNPLTSIPDENNPCRAGFPRNTPCSDFTFIITRKIIMERGGLPVYYTVQLPYYEFQIKWVEINLVKTFRIQVNPPGSIPIP